MIEEITDFDNVNIARGALGDFALARCKKCGAAIIISANFIDGIDIHKKWHLASERMQ